LNNTAFSSENDHSKNQPWLIPEAVYVHVPFCAHHCGYCDFAVTAGQDHLMTLYLEALEAEFKLTPKPRSQTIRTVFIGGGTPTYFNTEQLDRLFSIINTWIQDSSSLREVTLREVTLREVSIESTPDSLSKEKIAVMKPHGLNRVSVGVQSFQATSLAALDRLHRVSHIPDAVEMVKSQGLELSLDLIFAAPGSTLQTWENDLKSAISFQPDHISTYGLTYEKGTPLWKQQKAGTVKAVSEDTELAMYELSMDYLASQNFEHYEISNFAQTNKRCKHNEIYWANHAYYGFGVGAARYVHGVRELNCRNTNDYIRKLLSGESATFQSETLVSRERAFETIGVQIRRSQGISRSEFYHQTDFKLDDLVGQTTKNLVLNGLLIDDGTHICLTRRGFCVADGVIVEFMKNS
jgi:oxygen-independent coproporphyrinogen III oxidase